jgi:hypothetical protein
MRQIPAVQLPPRPTVIPKQKCGTCAYRTPSSPEELEMGVAYYLERPDAHPCHERRGVYCLGSHEQVQELERLVTARILARTCDEEKV